MIDKATMQKIIDEQDYALLTKELEIVKRLIDRHRRQKYPSLDFSSASLEQISRTTGRDFNVV